MAIYNFSVRFAQHHAPALISVETDEAYSAASRFAVEAVGELIIGGWNATIEDGYVPTTELVSYMTQAATPTPPPT